MGGSTCFLTTYSLSCERTFPFSLARSTIALRGTCVPNTLSTRKWSSVILICAHGGVAGVSGSSQKAPQRTTNHNTQRDDVIQPPSIWIEHNFRYENRCRLNIKLTKRVRLMSNRCEAEVICYWYHRFYKHVLKEQNISRIIMIVLIVFIAGFHSMYKDMYINMDPIWRKYSTKSRQKLRNMTHKKEKTLTIHPNSACTIPAFYLWLRVEKTCTLSYRYIIHNQHHRKWEHKYKKNK